MCIRRLLGILLLVAAFRFFLRNLIAVLIQLLPRWLIRMESHLSPRDSFGSSLHQPLHEALRLGSAQSVQRVYEMQGGILELSYRLPVSIEDMYLLLKN